MEECMIRGLCHKENDAVSAIQTAASRGFDIRVIREIAKKMVDSNWISSEKSESVLDQIIENRPPLKEEMQEVLDMNNLGEASDTGDLLQRKAPVDLDEMKASLNADQSRALNWMLETISNGKQLKVSIIGAGTGKSYLLKTFVEAAKQNGHVVQTMATTGVAAHLIGGCTVHHFFRLDIECKIYLEKGTAEYKLVQDCDMFIIDEFSLLERDVFITIDKLLRELAFGRNQFKPFGGKHIILLGDQLPAIYNDIYGTFTWKKFDIILLEEVMRQRNNDFLSILQKVRLGKCDEHVIQELNARKIAEYPTKPSDLENNAAVIVSLRKERDAINENILANLDGQERVYKAEDTDGHGNPISSKEEERMKGFHRERFADELHLKVGARVVLLKNMDVENGWVNGTLCTVTTLADHYIIVQSLSSKKFIIVRRVKQYLQYKHATSVIIRHQFPLCLGWALTVHKVQGTTLDKAYILLNENFFASGQAYTAISRVKSLENLFLLDFHPTAITLSDSHREVLQQVQMRNVISKTPVAGPEVPFKSPQKKGPVAGPEVPFKSPQKKGPVAGPEVPFKSPQKKGPVAGPEVPFKSPQKKGPVAGPEVPFKSPQKKGPVAGPEVPFMSPQKKGPVAGPEVPFKSPQKKGRRDKTWRKRTAPKGMFVSPKYSRRKLVATLEKDSREIHYWKKQVANAIFKTEEPLRIPNPVPETRIESPPRSIQKHLTNAHLCLDRIQGDGNCFYRCMSKELFGMEKFHLALRKVCMEHVENNLGTFGPYVDDDLLMSGRIHLTLAEYLQSQSQPGEWSYTTDAYAVSSLLGCCLKVLKENEQGESKWFFIQPLHGNRAVGLGQPPKGYFPLIYNESMNGVGQHFTRVAHLKVED